jgi:hypothetical protein
VPHLRRQCRPPPASRPAYNLGNFMRTLAMPKAAEPWSLTSLREKLIKIGAKVVSYATSRSRWPRSRCRDNVRRHPVADRPVAGATGAGMRASESKFAGQRGGKHASMQAKRYVSAFRYCQPLRSPPARAGRGLPCPRRSKGRSWPQSRRKSGECRIKLWTPLCVRLGAGRC